MWFLLTTIATAQTFDQPSRWHIQSEVELPAVMWMAADRNTEARMVGWNLDFVLNCDAGEALRRGYEVTCVIEDVAVRGAALPSDAGLLEKILLESDERLTGAEVELRTGPRGELRAVALHNLPDGRRRQTAMKENLRLMLSRAVAGFDQPVAQRDVEAGWAQRGGWIAQMPAGAGTLTGGKIVHERIAADGDTWTIASKGRVTLEPHSQQEWPPLGVTRAVHRIESPLHPLAWDQWVSQIGMVAWIDTDLEGTAVVEADGGALIERTWSAHGVPTPSSRVSMGAEGYPYIQRGSITRLDDGEAPDVGDSVEIDPPEKTPTAIQTWETLGVSW